MLYQTGMFCLKDDIVFSFSQASWYCMFKRKIQQGPTNKFKIDHTFFMYSIFQLSLSNLKPSLNRKYVNKESQHCLFLNFSGSSSYGGVICESESTKCFIMCCQE